MYQYINYDTIVKNITVNAFLKVTHLIEDSYNTSLKDVKGVNLKGLILDLGIVKNDISLPANRRDKEREYLYIPLFS